MMYSFVLKKYIRTRNKVVYSQGDKIRKKGYIATKSISYYFDHFVKEGEFEITRQRKKKAINLTKA